MCFYFEGLLARFRKVSRGQQTYAPMEIVVDTIIIFLLEHFGAKQLGPIAYNTASNRYGKVEET